MGKSLHFPFIYFLFKSSPVVLHPCHKLHYFKKAGWEEIWIETVQDIVHVEFDHTYTFMDINVEASVAMA